jgi:citrate lyase subunit beta/citryl-CoA lyase
MSSIPAPGWSERLLRTVLFVPGNDQRKLDKAGVLGADLVVIDLEDAVAEAEKTAARAVARNAIAGLACSGAVAVRVNGAESGRLQDDIAGVTAPGLSAIVVPKVEQVETLSAAAAGLAEAERDRDLPPGSVAVMAIIETPLGVVRCEEILLRAPPRTVAVMFGSADFSAAIGVDLTPDGSELSFARGRLIVAARAAGMVPAIDGPYLRLDDVEGLLSDTRRSRAHGFQGRVALHPRQLAPINRAYSELTDEQLAEARKVVDEFERAEAGGVASVRVDGNFVDYPVYHLARTKLRRHEAYLRSTRSDP